MDKNSFEYAKGIIEKLFEIPTNTDFSYPVADYIKDYRDIIERPMDLMTVKNNLAKGVYKTLKEWYDDICLVYNNCIKYYSQSQDRVVADLYIKLAEYNLNKFKMTAAFSCNSDQEWFDLTSKIYNKLFSTIKKCPFTINQLQNNSTDIPLTSREISETVEKLNSMVKDESTKKEIVKILKETDPEIELNNDELTINAEDLKQETMNALWYMLNPKKFK